MAYAHQRLVVHRDLKANNILVTAEGTTKLLDFGIAKLLDQDAVGAEHTQTAARAMTPDSASPEQIRGAAVSTATDVYALGVLIYRLLTGRRPYTANTRDPVALARAICQDDPPAPSLVVTLADASGPSPEERAACRGTSPALLRRRLAGAAGARAVRKGCGARRMADEGRCRQPGVADGPFVRHPIREELGLDAVAVEKALARCKAEARPLGR